MSENGGPAASHNPRLAKVPMKGNLPPMTGNTPPDDTERRHRAGFIVRLVLIAGVAVTGIVLMTKFGTDPAVWFEHADKCPPAVFFLLLALLPLFGFPLAPLYIFAGATYGLARGLPLTLAGIAVHLALAYPFYGVLLREPVRRLLATRGYALPEFSKKNRLRATIIIASVPALPFWAQNAVLALARVPFAMYFAVSFGVHILIATAVIALGMEARKHSASPWFLVIISVAGIVSGALAWRKYRRLSRGNHPT